MFLYPFGLPWRLLQKVNCKTGTKNWQKNQYSLSLNWTWNERDLGIPFLHRVPSDDTFLKNIHAAFRKTKCRQFIWAVVLVLAVAGYIVQFLWINDLKEAAGVCVSQGARREGLDQPALVPLLGRAGHCGLEIPLWVYSAFCGSECIKI